MFIGVHVSDRSSPYGVACGHVVSNAMLQKCIKCVLNSSDLQSSRGITYNSTNLILCVV